MQTRSGRLFAQYPYRQDPVFANPDPPGSFAVNGVSNKLRLFAIDVTGATNVLDEPIDNAVPVRKRLVADLADFGRSTVDNVEGMTWGPCLRTGERTLLLVSDDNFAANQVTQVIALALR